MRRHDHLPKVFPNCVVVTLLFYCHHTQPSNSVLGRKAAVQKLRSQDIGVVKNKVDVSLTSVYLLYFEKMNLVALCTVKRKLTAQRTSTQINIIIANDFLNFQCANADWLKSGMLSVFCLEGRAYFFFSMFSSTATVSFNATFWSGV